MECHGVRSMKMVITVYYCLHDDGCPDFRILFILLLGSNHALLTAVNSVCLPKFQDWSDGSRGLYRLVICF